MQPRVSENAGSVLGSSEYPVPLSGEAQLLASLALLGPFLGQGVPEVGQGDVSDAEDDADLAVLDLAEPAAPRPLHPDRSIALLGEGRGIDDEPGVGAADRAGDLMVQFVAGRLVVPATSPRNRWMAWRSRSAPDEPKGLRRG